MAVYDLEEQEQLDELKTWWRLHGNTVTALVTVVALALAGWQGWNWWQHKAHGEASAIYNTLQEAAGLRDAKRSRELAGMLIDQYSRTSYAGMGALVAAKVQVDAGDRKNARVQLEWALTNASDPALRELARLRLVTVLLDEQAYDEASAKLSSPALAGFETRHAELTGDVLASQGKATEAKAAYVMAIEHIGKHAKTTGQPVAGAERSENAMRDFINSKIDALGGLAQSQALPATDKAGASK